MSCTIKLKTKDSFKNAPILTSFAHTAWKLYKVYCNGRDETYLNLSKKLFDLTSKEDHLPSMVNLGFILSNGSSGETDFKKALELYETAAQKNIPEALTNLAGMYHHGIGVDRDLDKAITYYKKARALDDIYASYQLGCISLQGIGKIKKNRSQARTYFEEVLAPKNKADESLRSLAQIRIDQIDKEIAYKQQVEKEKKQENKVENEAKEEKIEKKIENSIAQELEVSYNNNPNFIDISEKKGDLLKEIRHSEKKKGKKEQAKKEKKEQALKKADKESDFIQNHNNSNEQNFIQEDEDSSGEEPPYNRYEELTNSTQKNIVYHIFNDLLNGRLISNKTTTEEIRLIFNKVDSKSKLVKAKGSHKKLIFENEELKSEGPVSIPRQPGSPYVKPHYLRICFEKLLALNCFPPVLEEELIKKGYLPEKKEFRKK